MHKACTKCGATKPCSQEHFRLSTNGRGKQSLSAKCLDCIRQEARNKQAQLRQQFPEKMAAQRRAYRATENGKAKRAKAEKDRLFRADVAKRGEHVVRAELMGRLLSVLHGVAHSLDWPDGKPSKKVCWLWNKPGITEAESYRIRYRLDETFQLAERMRRQINKKLKRDGIAEVMRSALRRGGKSNRVEQLLGYTISELCAHIERQFTNGMSWDAFMAGRIHIDHITPQAAFDLTDDEQWRQCWCLSNLRPAWARDNLAKSAKRQFLI